MNSLRQVGKHPRSAAAGVSTDMIRVVVSRGSMCYPAMAGGLAEVLGQVAG